MLEALLHGALARGTNAPTLVLLNACLVGCILVCASLVVLGLPSELLPHIIALLALALALLASINWLLAQTGLVSAEEQRQELFGESQQEPQQGQQAQQAEEDKLERKGRAIGFVSTAAVSSSGGAWQLQQQEEQVAVEQAAAADPKDKDQ